MYLGIPEGGGGGGGGGGKNGSYIRNTWHKTYSMWCTYIVTTEHQTIPGYRVSALLQSKTTTASL